MGGWLSMINVLLYVFLGGMIISVGLIVMLCISALLWKWTVKIMDKLYDEEGENK